MQKDTAMPPPPAPLAPNSTAGTSAGPSKDGAGHPKVCRKPSISKVILRTVEGKGVGSQVSLATLKKALATTGYDIIRNAWRFKVVLKKLVEKGMLKQVTGKGASGSFRMGKKFASKFKLKARRQQRRRSQQPRQPRRQQQHRQAGQRQSGQQRQSRRLQQLLLGSNKQGQKRLAKGARRAARRRN